MEQCERIKKMKITTLTDGYKLVEFPILSRTSEDITREAFNSYTYEGLWRWRDTGQQVDNTVRVNLDAEIARRRFEAQFDTTLV